MSKHGRVITTHPVSTSKRKFEVSIRLNVHTGVFSAEVDGREHQSDRLSALRKIISSAARILDGDESSPWDGQFVNVIDIPDAGEK